MPLIVTIDLVPGGNLTESREIGRLILTRVASRRATLEASEYGDYKLLIRRDSLFTPQGRLGEVEMSGIARNVRRDDNVWYFLHDVLEQMETDE